MMTFKIETAVVTGAVTGVGTETALLLAARGVRRLVLLNRSAERTQPLLGRLKKRYPAVTATVVEGDLAEVDGVRAAAMELARVAPRIDLLVNNAGVLTETLQFNKAGVELHFAVNALAPFLLTHLLKRELLQGAPARDIVISG